MQDADTRVLAAIKRWKDLPKSCASLEKVLDYAGSGGCLRRCGDQIAETGLIDGEDVQMDFINFPDLLLTADGFFLCREILKEYMHVSLIREAADILTDEDALNRSINCVARMLRGSDSEELWRMYRETRKTDSSSAARMRKYIRAEAWSRTVFAGAWRKTVRLAAGIYAEIRYRWLFKIIRKHA